MLVDQDPPQSFPAQGLARAQILDELNLNHFTGGVLHGIDFGTKFTDLLILINYMIFVSY